MVFAASQDFHLWVAYWRWRNIGKIRPTMNSLSRRDEVPFQASLPTEEMHVFDLPATWRGRIPRWVITSEFFWNCCPILGDCGYVLHHQLQWFHAELKKIVAFPFLGIIYCKLITAGCSWSFSQIFREGEIMPFHSPKFDKIEADKTNNLFKWCCLANFGYAHIP